MKGIFCIEGFWYGDHRDRTSVKPVLDLLNCYQTTPFIHHKCSTVEEFEFSIGRWKTKAFHQKYPLLWLAFHGAPGEIAIGKSKITISDLESILKDKCEGSVIYFGSCATMKWDKRSLQSFMEKTKTVAVLGYKNDIDWLPSASFEIRMLSYFNKGKFTTDSLKKIRVDIDSDCRSLINNLKFRFEINERYRFTQKRIKRVVKTNV